VCCRLKSHTANPASGRLTPITAEGSACMTCHVAYVRKNLTSGPIRGACGNSALRNGLEFTEVASDTAIDCEPGNCKLRRACQPLSDSFRYDTNDNRAIVWPRLPGWSRC
jgi:hypothetical protein